MGGHGIPRLDLGVPLSAEFCICGHLDIEVGITAALRLPISSEPRRMLRWPPAHRGASFVCARSHSKGCAVLLGMMQVCSDVVNSPKSAGVHAR